MTAISHYLGEDMNKRLAPFAVSIGLLGLVGGIAAAQAFKPAEKPAPSKVQFVQPAAATSTPTTATPVPTVTVTATAKPVQSVKAKAPAPAPVQRQAVVSEPTPTDTSAADPGTGTLKDNPDGSKTVVMQPGQKPPVIPAHTPPPTSP